MSVKKPGWTQIPNFCLETLPSFTECELKVFLWIVRQTTGWKGRKNDLSATNIGAAIGMSERSVRESLSSLVGRDLVASQKQFRADGGCSSNLYEMAIEEDTPPAAECTPPMQPTAWAPMRPASGVNKEERKEEERNTSISPTPPFEDSGAEFLTPAELIRKFGQFKNFRKPRQVDRERATVRLSKEGVKLTAGQSHSSMEGYRQSPWGKENGWPIMGWAKDPLSWIVPLDKQMETDLERDTSAPQFRTSPATFAVALDLVDPLFENYLQIFIAAGVAIGETERVAAAPSWIPLTHDQKIASGKDALRICMGASDPRFIKSPAKHLADKPWTRVFRDRVLPTTGPMLDKNAEARRISRQRGLM